MRNGGFLIIMKRWAVCYLQCLTIISLTILFICEKKLSETRDRADQLLYIEAWPFLASIFLMRVRVIRFYNVNNSVNNFFQRLGVLCEWISFTETGEITVSCSEWNPMEFLIFNPVVAIDFNNNNLFFQRLEGVLRVAPLLSRMSALSPDSEPITIEALMEGGTTVLREQVQ